MTRSTTSIRQPTDSIVDVFLLFWMEFGGSLRFGDEALGAAVVLGDDALGAARGVAECTMLPGVPLITQQSWMLPWILLPQHQFSPLPPQVERP